jgi:hypothetical protein
MLLLPLAMPVLQERHRRGGAVKFCVYEEASVGVTSYSGPALASAPPPTIRVGKRFTVSVIRGTYAAPELLAERIDQRQYRDAYADIRAASRREGRCFVMDLHADGLYASRDRDAPFDIVYRNGTDEAVYNGDWMRHQLTRSAYLERFASDDAEYARMLAALAAALSRVSPSLQDASKRDS